MAALITAADRGMDTTTDQGLFDWTTTTALARPMGRPPLPDELGDERGTA
jgi:hypothetical protein